MLVPPEWREVVSLSSHNYNMAAAPHNGHY